MRIKHCAHSATSSVHDTGMRKGNANCSMTFPIRSGRGYLGESLPQSGARDDDVMVIRKKVGHESSCELNCFQL